MNTDEMNPGAAEMVRDELAAIGTKSSRLQRHRRRIRILTVGMVAVLVVGAQATNGKDGYVLVAQWTAFHGSGYIPVYESDGTTVIGRFSIGITDPAAK